METALIGYTGFVGGNLRTQHEFDRAYNSSNFQEMAGRQFGLVVCAGVPAVKWLANQQPEEDRRKIAELEQVLQRVTAERFVLISTVDVYPVTEGVDERFACHGQENHAYGRNRLAFEEFVLAHFADAYVIRLPGLFGPGLKKNVIYDLLHENQLEVINPQSRFQWYDLTRLWDDIETAMAHGLRLMNLVNEPSRTGDIIDRYFPAQPVGSNPAPPAVYDIQTLHAALYDGTDGYVQSSEEVMQQIGRYVQSERGDRLS